jgi:lipid-binding SYLF domain-containing protein
MMQLLRMLLAIGLVFTALPCSRLSAQGHVASTLASASEVLDGLQTMPLKGIPPILLSRAQGVAIIPRVIKVGLGIGGRFGEGIVLARGPNGTWCNPIFISFTGGSVGWQVGVQSTDIVLVFKTRRSFDRLLEGKGKITLGADVAIAAGPVGRQAEADTDARLQAEIYSYSRTRGLFVGVSLEGAVIRCDGRDNEEFTKRPRQEDVLAAEKVKAQLMAMSAPPPPVIMAPIRPLLIPASPEPPPAGLPTAPVPLPSKPPDRPEN